MRYLSNALPLAALLQSAAAFTLPNVPPTFATHYRHRHASISAYPKVQPTLTSLHSASTEELTPGIIAIGSMNGELEPLLDNLREQPYLRLYSVDMLGSCEYMPQELFECYSETCEIYPIDEEEVSSLYWSGGFQFIWYLLYFYYTRTVSQLLSLFTDTRRHSDNRQGRARF